MGCRGSTSQKCEQPTAKEEEKVAEKASTAQQEKRAEVDRSDVAADVVEVLSFLQFQPRDIILDTELKVFIPDYFPATGSVPTTLEPPRPGEVVAKESALPPKESRAAAEEAICCCSNGEQLDEDFVRIEEVAEEYNLPNAVLESHVVAEEEKSSEADQESHVAADEVKYILSDKKSCGAFLQEADVRLIRAEWLYHLRRFDMPLPRRQEADHAVFGPEEKSGLVSHEEVAQWAMGRKDAIICSVSHGWGTREHPDPCRWQLGQLVDCIALYDAAYFSDIWVFYDYTSLYQFERETTEQEDSFTKGMQNMHVMYAHDFNLTLRIQHLTPNDIWDAAMADEDFKIPVYHLPSKSVKALPLRELVSNRTDNDKRGWCRAEKEWSAMRGISAQNQVITGPGVGSGKLFDPGIVHFGGKVPQLPQVFEQDMATSAFTHRHDAPEVVRLQRKVFHEKVTTSKEVRLQWLPYEELDRLIEALPHFQELRVFRLNHFQATMAQLEALGQVLAAKELQTLEIGHCKEFYGFNCGLRGLGKAVAEIVKVTKSIKVLILPDNNIQNHEAQAIAASLEVNRTIRKVDLSDNFLGVEGAQALLAALRNNRRVKIVLNKKHISPYSKEVKEEIEKLVEASKGEDNEEAPEDDSKNGAFPSPPRIKHLADWILAQNKGVDLIGMSGRQKGDEEVKALAAALKENRQVRRVELQNNGFGDAGAEALAEMLHQNRTIKEIVLSSNRITTVGAKALLEALRVNKVVTYISLDDNGEISEEVRTEIWEIVGANKVAAYVLTLNESVTEIDLRCKEFGAEGMKVLTAALKENKQVTKINLCRCIGDVGAQALAEMLHQNRTIKTIVLRSNRITTVGAKALLEALRVNKVVTYISLDKNGDISEEVKKEIEEVLEAQVEEEGEVFDFSMQKSGGGLGFDAVLRRAYIVVTEIFDDGDVVETNNAIAEPTNRLKAGDFIVDVNGIKGDSDAMARKFNDSQEVKMTIKRIHS